ncbi:MAG: hypothetical protein H0U70_04390 [Tatlockia sp.]|nr:hypothetical protein [Tatlockia sp.]
MTDPLAELEESLAYMFELQTAQGHGRFINPRVDELKIALDSYKKDRSKLPLLNQAVQNAFSVIENYVDGYKVKNKLEALTGSIAELNPVKSYESSTNACETNFISWISLKIGKDFTSLNAEKKVQALLNEQKEKEVRVKLGVHLHIEPDFLLNLALASTNNFIKLLSSRLGFKFEKQQIAKAIYHHGDTLIDASLALDEQIDSLINFFDKRLSPKGYSIEKLLNDPLAKPELEKLHLFQHYQSQAFKNRESSINSSKFI